MLNKKLLQHKDLKDICLSFAVYCGVIPENDDFDQFVKDRLGDQKRKEKIREEVLTALAIEMQSVVPDHKVFPSRKPLRGNIKDLVKKLITFEECYNKEGKYTPEIMIEAARRYGVEAESKDWQFTSPLNFFIIKDDQSRLADDCEEILRGNSKPEVKRRLYKSDELI